MQSEKELTLPYCENCFEEELEEYVIDSLGGTFCSEKCFLESQEYRDADVSTLTIVNEKGGK